MVMTRRIGRAVDYRKYRIEVGHANREPNSPVEYEPTIAEARKRRTIMARGIGLPSHALIIINNITQEVTT
jgi:hypothetical protein